MEPRPTALTVVAALNRLGAVAVLLRPDGDVEREAELGEIARVVSDPEHMAEAGEGRACRSWSWAVAPGRATSAADVVDMERIDPDEVKLPGWYKPNPGRARDLAFILFTGSGDRTRPNRITNRRWILSAFGTAASASLSEADTVYSVTPVYHPSGLMVSFGGAIAGGARIAMARDFDPATFWDEVRRYGVTVGTYTWTMLRDLVEAPPNPNERHHPGPPVHGLRHAAGALDPRASTASRPPGSSSSTPRPRARWSLRTSPARRSARWAARCRAPPACGSPRSTWRAASSRPRTTASRASATRTRSASWSPRSTPT